MLHVMFHKLIFLFVSHWVTIDAATCNYGYSPSVALFPGLYAEGYCNNFDFGSSNRGSHRFECDYSTSPPTGLFFYYNNSQDCSGFYTTVQSESNYTNCCQNCGNNCVVTSVLGEYYDQSGNCGSTSVNDESFLSYMLSFLAYIYALFCMLKNLCLCNYNENIKRKHIQQDGHSRKQ